MQVVFMRLLHIPRLQAQTVDTDPAQGAFAVICSKCQYEDPRDSVFCLGCGARITEDVPLLCPACGAELPAGADWLSSEGSAILTLDDQAWC